MNEPRLTFDELFREYLHHLRTVGARPRSIKLVEQTAMVCTRAVGTAPVHTITLKAIVDHIAHVHAKPNTRNLWLNYIRAALNRHTANGGDLYNVAALTRFKTTQERIRILTPDQVVALEGYCMERDTPECRIVLLTLIMGMRRSEILALDKMHYDALGITVPETVAKNRRARTIPWQLIGVARHLLEPLPTCSRDIYYRTFRRASKVVGTKVRPHDLRRTCATYLMSAGTLSSYDAATLLGHTEAVAIKRYRGPRRWDCAGATIPEWLGLHRLVSKFTAPVVCTSETPAPATP